jgi:hypothetical protein
MIVGVRDCGQLTKEKGCLLVGGASGGQGSFILPAHFFAQSAVISSSQSISLASRGAGIVHITGTLLCTVGGDLI